MIDTCAIWGTTNYVNSWLSINILVIIASLMAIALAYSLSSFFPSRTRGKIQGFVRFEMIQLIISIVILAALLALSATACGLSSTISQSLTKTTMNPFQYADYYIGAVSLGKGLTLLSNIYSTSVSYSIYAAVVQVLPNTVLRLAKSQLPLFKNNPLIDWLTGRSGKGGAFSYSLSSVINKYCNGYCEYERIPSTDLGYLYGLFSSLYLDVYSPIILVAVGMLFIQFLALPIMEYTAFTIILPVALAMRSISFFGASLGDASNAMIAIALAFYIIYPLTVAFDSYAVAYVFSPGNPSSQYVNLAFTLNSVTPNAFFQAQPGFYGTGGSALVNESRLVLGSFFSGYNPYAPGLAVISTLRSYTNQMAQFIFISILLFALNVSVTVGLAVSLYKALKSGLGEAGRFW